MKYSSSVLKKTSKIVEKLEKKLPVFVPEDVRDKRVIVRVDFNVQLDAKGDVCETYKVRAATATIKALLSAGARSVALLTHIGRPDGRWSEGLSTARIVDDVERIVRESVTWVPACRGPRVVEALEKQDADGTVPRLLLLENVRFEIGDEENDLSFASDVFAPFDVFINDAFSVSHRAHASVVGAQRIIPMFAGLRLVKEVAALCVVRDGDRGRGPAQPSVAIVGGAKIATKLPFVLAMAARYSVVLVGGKLANEMIDEGISLPSNVMLPVDFVGKREDVGPETIAQFTAVVSQAKTVVWNGPLGRFEVPEFRASTAAVVAAIGQNSHCFSVVGGGETIQFLEEERLAHNVSFLSTGGGAMLAYLSGEPMPGIDVLVKSET